MELSAWEQLRKSTADKLRQVRGRIAETALHAGRDPESVKLVAVTKYVTADEGMEAALADAGCTDFGENRVPRLLEKWAFLKDAQQKESAVPFPDPRKVAWHFIGSLQRNKVRRLLPCVSLIHSIDTPELFDAVARIMGEENNPATRTYARQDALLPFPKKIPVLLEVNISGEGTNTGSGRKRFSNRRRPALRRMSLLKYAA